MYFLRILCGIIPSIKFRKIISKLIQTFLSQESLVRVLEWCMWLNMKLTDFTFKICWAVRLWSRAFINIATHFVNTYDGYLQWHGTRDLI